MIKLVIFDLSDTCFNLEEPPFVKKLCERNNVDFDTFYAYYNELLSKSEVNEITGKEVCEKSFAKFNIQEDANEAIKEMMEGKEKLDEVMEFIKELRKKYKTAYVTNYNKDYWDLIVAKFEMNEWFDYGLVSYQIKARKPSEVAFKKMLEHFGVNPEEAVYTDDIEKNLVPPKEMGIHVIPFKNLEQFKAELNGLENV